MPNVGVGRWRIEKGDRLRLFYNASAAAISFVWARIWYDDGSSGELNIPDFTSTSDRVPVQVDSPGNLSARMGGWIVGGMWDLRVSGAKRGQLYGEVCIYSGGDIKDMVCKGYLYDYNGVPFGQYTERGPGGGEGYLHVETLATDVAGNVDTTVTLAATNAFRKYYGIVVYYNCAAVVATRTLNIIWVRPWGAFATGMTASGIGYVFNPSGVSMTTGEEGVLFIYNPGGRGDGYTARNDNGTLTVDSTATAPNPFPLLVVEGDPGTLVIDISSGDAGDVYSAYALVEEWLVV